MDSNRSSCERGREVEGEFERERGKEEARKTEKEIDEQLRG